MRHLLIFNNYGRILFDFILFRGRIFEIYIYSQLNLRDIAIIYHVRLLLFFLDYIRKVKS